MEPENIIIVSVFSAAWALMMVIVLVLCCQLTSLRKKLAEMQAMGRLRVQKLTIDNDKNHAFHNPAISPDEELSRRGYSMYVPEEDVESGRGTERQTGGQFVEELTREIDNRQQRKETPPFLLQSIEDNKKKTRSLANPVANGNMARQSNTNPNFIY